jgi:hypothetical protein
MFMSGKLPTFVVEILKLNETTRVVSGEGAAAYRLQKSENDDEYVQ